MAMCYGKSILKLLNSIPIAISMDDQKRFLMTLERDWDGHRGWEGFLGQMEILKNFWKI
jgi:hypothetical protein